MSRLNEIKNEYAKEMAFDDWNHLVAKIMSESKGFSFALNVIMLHNDEVTKLYAEECCVKTLENASENATTRMLSFGYNNYEVNPESITNPDNIVL